MLLHHAPGNKELHPIERRKTNMRNIILFLLLSIGLQAAPMFILDNPDLTIAPGETGEWEFRLEADDTHWVSVTGSFLLFETDPLIGLYEDEIGMQGGPDGRLAPGAPDWVGTLARYQVSPLASIGAFNNAVLVVLYELFSDDPATCDSCLLESSSFETNVSVSVVAPPDVVIPEPGTWQLLAAAAGLLALARWRRWRC
jgi:hypothetical protein